MANEWDGSTDTDWSEDTNWSLGHKPQAGEDVVIPPTSNDPETTENSDFYGDLTVQSGAKLTINAGHSLKANTNNKTLTVDSGALLDIDGSSGSDAILDINSLSNFDINIDGYLKMNNGVIDNMNNSTPIDIHGGWITAWNSQINGLVRWRFSGCARCIQLVQCTVTKYLLTPTLTADGYTFTFDIKYSSIEITDDNTMASSNIPGGTTKSIKTGQKERTLKIEGACLNTSWDVIEELRGLCVEQSDGTYKKLTFMCNDLPNMAISGYMKIINRFEGPLYPKMYQLIIVESRF